MEFFFNLQETERIKMKRFWGFVIKEFYHIFRDFRTMIVLFMIPILLVLLFGFVINNDIKDAKIAILDNSKDNITRNLTQKITSSGYFKLDRNLYSYNGIEEIFQEGNVKMVLIFEADFGKNLEKLGTANLQVLTDASEPNTANILVSYMNALVLDFTREQMMEQKINIMQITPEPRMLFNPTLESSFYFIPGIIAMLMIIISTLMTSITITREKELGTMEILLVSPLKAPQIIIGKVLPYLLVSFIDFIIIIVLGMIVFKMPIQGNLGLLIAEGLLYIFMALSLGVLFSTIANNQQTAMMMSLLGLMLPTILLSGFVYPIENMHWILQLFSNIVPSRWFIIIVKNIMLKGVGIEYIWKETLIIGGMTLLFILISIKKFKNRLE
jgi:ABC-2 type transport system permease protein